MYTRSYMDIKITINGVAYPRLEDVPEAYREAVRKQVEAARASAESAAQDAAGPSKRVVIQRHFDIKFNINRAGAASPGAPNPAPPGAVPADASAPGPLRAEGFSGLKLVFLVLAFCGMVAWVLLKR